MRRHEDRAAGCVAEPRRHRTGVRYAYQREVVREAQPGSRCLPTVRHGQGGVALRPERAGADHDDVADGAQQLEHDVVGRRVDGARPAVGSGDRPVEAGREVGSHPRTLAGLRGVHRRQGRVVERVAGLDPRHGGQVRHEEAHAGDYVARHAAGPGRMADMAKKAKSRASATIEELLRVGPGFRLADVDCESTPGFDGGKRKGKEALADHAAELGEWQERLFAESKGGGTRSLLLVVQGMDTSGKGGVMRHVVSQIDPEGIRATAFKAPSAEERKHDFLWRIRNALPGPGKLGCLRPLPLRGRPRGARPRPRAPGRVVEALRADQRLRARGHRVRHPHRQGDDAHLQGRAEGAAA